MPSRWEYTRVVRADSRFSVRSSGVYTTDGGHTIPIIERDSAVDCAVDLRSAAVSTKAEAIVVDSYEPEYADQYTRLWNGFEKKIGKKPTAARLSWAAQRIVKNSIVYSLPLAKSFGKLATVDGGRDVNLGLYLDVGYGVCRHQGLAATWLLQKAYNEGITNAWASSDANFVEGADGGGHAWSRLTEPSEGGPAQGNVWIIDPAQDFCGPLETAVLRRKWDYVRPGEMSELTKRIYDLNPIQKAMCYVGLPVN